MNHKSKRTRAVALIIVGTLALAALLLAATGAWAGPSERVLAQPLSPSGVVSSTLTYQGQLLADQRAAGRGARLFPARAAG